MKILGGRHSRLNRFPRRTKRDFLAVLRKAQRVLITTGLMPTLFLAPFSLSQAPTTGDKEVTSAIVGDWHGESVCVVKPGSCRDEESLYTFSICNQQPDRFILKADKIVDGKRITMGTPACICEFHEQSLQCRLPAAVIQFVVTANQMQGEMKLQDGTLWRKLSLKKVK